MLFRDDCPINSTHRVCVSLPQSLLSSAQVSVWNQHPQCLKVRWLTVSCSSSRTSTFTSFTLIKSLLFLQTDGEREQLPNIPSLPTMNLQSLSETWAAKVPPEKSVTSQWRWARWDCPLTQASVAPGALKGAYLWQFAEQAQSNYSRATANFQDHRMRNRSWETEGWILTFLKFFLHN